VQYRLWPPGRTRSAATLLSATLGCRCSCREQFLGIPPSAIEPASDARRQVPWSGRFAARHKWVGVASGPGVTRNASDALGHCRRARGVHDIIRQKSRQVVGGASASEHPRNRLRLRNDWNDCDVRKLREPAQCSVHIERSEGSRRDNQHQCPLRSFLDRGNCDGPYRSETGAACDQHCATSMVWPEKGAAERTRQSRAVADTDVLADRRSNNPVSNFSNVEMQQAGACVAYQRIGGAAAPCGKTAKPHFAY
jgi:hypothetical protein